MRTKLRKTFYIGLGGTGMNAILRTKKMFVEKYGKVPPMIGFLGIDTDGGAYEKKLKTKSGEDVQLEPFEQCSISVKTPKDYYQSNKRRLTWLPENNVNMITSLDKGAGQVRTNGRLALVNKISNVSTAISNVYAQISSNQIIDNPEYELISTEKTDVHIVFSVCGGTGCGTFLDVAYLLRSMYNRGTRAVNISGYGVLPNVFHEMNKVGNAMAKTKPNAYGAIEDLDFLMHIGPANPPVNFDWISEQYDAQEPPFDAMFFVDNRNENNVVYSHVDNLAEMISLALLCASGEIGKDTASITDNVEKCMIEGDLNVNNKRAWASTIGASQITFKGQQLAEVYGLLVKQRLIQRLMNACYSGDEEANQWIDLPEVNIRENNGQDNVINFLCSNAIKDFDVDIKDIANIQVVIDDFSKMLLERTNKNVSDKVLVLKERVVEQLHEKTKKILAIGDCGVSLANDTLAAIVRQVNLFVQEMTDEKEELNEKIPTDENRLKSAIAELKSYSDKFIKSKSKQRELIDDVKNIAKALLKKRVEIIRRTGAIQFYNSLLNELVDEVTVITNIKNMLVKVSQDISQSLSEHRNSKSSLNTVDVDLTEESWDLIKVNDESIVISQFFNLLHKQNLYNVTRLEDISEALDTYVKSFNEYKMWENMTIDDVINQKSEEQFKLIIKRAMDKAVPFLKINGHGKLTSSAQLEIQHAINRYYFVCLPNKENSRFTRDDYFKKLNDSTLNISFSTTGMTDKIIIYRQDGTIPAFAIDGIELFNKDSYRSSISYHFDHNIERRMKEEKYQLMPKDSSEEALSLWVHALVFGLIKYDETKRHYFYRDENTEDTNAALNDFMVDTGEHYRDQAFTYFDHKLGELKDQYEEYISNKIQAMGTDNWKALVQDVRENYIAKYSQCPVDLKSNTRNQGPVKELMAKEIKYITKEFGK